MKNNEVRELRELPDQQCETRDQQCETPAEKTSGTAAEKAGDAASEKAGDTRELVQYADEQTQKRAGAPGAHASFDRLVRTIWRLRQSDGCPWDKEQTHQSIAKNMIEEAYEAFDALSELDASIPSVTDASAEADRSASTDAIEHLQEELGDVLMQVVIHAQIASDTDEFTIDDICEQLNEKLVRRHPHIFADQHAHSIDDVLALWEKVKDEERERSIQAAEQGANQATVRAVAPKPEGLLASIPKTFPALMQAQKVGKRLRKAGLLMEELCSEQIVAGSNAPAGEYTTVSLGTPLNPESLGELLFLLTQQAQQQGIDAETALRAYTTKLMQRWAYVEHKAWKAKVNEHDVPDAPASSSISATAGESCKQWWCESKAIIGKAEDTR